MNRVEYRMTAADLRTFDRWHARGAAILLAVLVLMPWLLGIGPNAVREGARAAAAPTASSEGASSQGAASRNASSRDAASQGAASHDVPRPAATPPGDPSVDAGRPAAPAASGG
jgi:hypothetical protein